MSKRKKTVDADKDLKKYPFLTDKGVQIIRRCTTPRTAIGLGMYASYKDYGEVSWKIGYGSLKLGKRLVGAFEKATQRQIDDQLAEDLKEFSIAVSEYVFVPLNSNRKAAILSFANSLGLIGFKNSRLLELINTLAPKTEIIREWSPYINTIWRSGGDSMINRRRIELDTFYAAGKEIPTHLPHKCGLKFCLLNVSETFNGAPNQIRAVEYLEKKINEWDPSGEVIRRFARYWDEKPSGLASPQRLKNNF